jgi:hypothetical protein
MPRIIGVEKVIARLEGAVGEKAVREVGQALYVGAQSIVAEAAHMITEGSVSGKHHIASLPHEPPNEDSGVLRSHLEAIQTGPLSAEASSNAPYAVPLEVGSSTIIERPYMGPATRRKKAEIIENVRKAVNRNLAKR